MASDNETVENVCDKLRQFRDCDGDYVREIEDLADEAEAAHKHEIAAKDEEIEKLRKLVNELTEVVSITRPKFCNGCPGAICSIAGEPCGFVSHADELIARARETIGGATL